MRDSLLFCGLLVLSVCWAVTASAQDRVTFVPAGGNGVVTEKGEVLDYTGRELVLRTLNGTQHLASESVKRIETRYESNYQKGLQALQGGETDLAERFCQQALPLEHRPWVQREIRAALMRCALRRADLSGAAREFRQIVQSDPETLFWGMAPLVWSPLVISPVVKEEMRSWLTSGHQADQILAASGLLLDPMLGDEAEGVLLQLSRQTNPIIASYSRAQLWRLSIASRHVTETMQESWRSDIGRLRPELRSGPQYLLARGYESRGEFRQAAAEAIWLPTVYIENEPLSARALFDAADWLDRSGLPVEAELLRRELLSGYAWSREASVIRSQQKQPDPAPGELKR